MALSIPAAQPGTRRPSARRGRNKAAVAVARKLCVAIWHLLHGHPIGALEPVQRLEVKLGKLATELGLKEIKAQGYESKTAFIEKRLYLLRSYPRPNHMSASPG